MPYRHRLFEFERQISFSKDFGTNPPARIDWSRRDDWPFPKYRPQREPRTCSVSYDEVRIMFVHLLSSLSTGFFTGPALAELSYGMLRVGLDPAITLIRLYTYHGTPKQFL